LAAATTDASDVSSNRETIQRLNEFRILSGEQPAPALQARGPAYIREHSEIPVMVDERVWSPIDAWRVVQTGALNIINVYVVEAGGIYSSLKISHLAALASHIEDGAVVSAV